MTKRSIALTAMAAVFSAAVLTPLAAQAQSRSVGGVHARLADIGITPDQIIEINSYPGTDGSDGRSRGSTAWIKVEQCPEGFIVMSVGRTGVVTSAWTHGNCEIPALDDC